ncbi:MAG: Sporulation and cell division protein SsgA, partial [uncultured Blastococcus sp.]
HRSRRRRCHHLAAQPRAPADRPGPARRGRRRAAVARARGGRRPVPAPARPVGRGAVRGVPRLRRRLPARHRVPRPGGRGVGPADPGRRAPRAAVRWIGPHRPL